MGLLAMLNRKPTQPPMIRFVLMRGRIIGGCSF